MCEFKGCLVANNVLPLGAKVEIEGLGTCTVLDRLNKRYNNQPDRFDYYMGMDLEGAINWGVRELAYNVL